jgi:hypothetical protein
LLNKKIKESQKGLLIVVHLHSLGIHLNKIVHSISNETQRAIVIIDMDPDSEIFLIVWESSDERQAALWLIYLGLPREWIICAVLVLYISSNTFHLNLPFTGTKSEPTLLAS